MTNDFNDAVIEQIQSLYNENEHARSLFDSLALRQNDARWTSIERICKLLGVSRGDAVAIARRLEEAKCGEFIVGRRGQKSRFSWAYSCISLGKAAAGELNELETADNPMADGEDDEDAQNVSTPGTRQAQAPLRLTIPEAKAALAYSLGVPVANIEIVVRG
jgi:hypothetical protein